MKKIGFLSFGHWNASPHSKVRTASASSAVADLVASFLYRHRTSQTRPASSDVDGVSVSFEADIYKVLGGEELTLPEEHRQLANEFRFIRTEVEDIRHFDELMDSGIMDRVRELKARFGKSFFHPRVLAVSTWMMRSPARIPASSAGVPGRLLRRWRRSWRRRGPSWGWRCTRSARSGACRSG